MRPSRWLKRVSLIVLLAMAFQTIGVPITLARLVITATHEVAQALPSPATEALSGAADRVLSDLSPEAWAAPAAAPLAEPLSAPLCHDPGDTSAMYEDEDTCLEGEDAGSSISYAGRRLSLSHTLGSAGPLLILRYDSRPQPVPMVLSAWVPTLTPIQHWTIQIAGWTFEGEGSQPLALWDTTAKATGKPVPAGVYDMEIQYENEMGVGSTLDTVIVRRSDAGAVGANWWHNYEVSLQVIDDERVLLTAFGYAQVFVGKQDKSTSTSAQGHTLTHEADGTWRWVRNGADGAPVQGATTLDADGRATRWEEPSGRHLSFEYDDQGRLLAIADQSGHKTALTYEGERVAGVTDAAGSTWTLGYNDDDLVTIADPLKAGWVLSYDDAHRLTAKVDPLGSRTGYCYQADGQLAEIVDPAGHRVTFETELNTTPYATGSVQTVAPVLGTTVVTYITAAGVTTSEHRYSYDGHGRVVRTVRSPDGGDTEYVWQRTWGWGDNAGLLLSETDAAGLTTTYSYRSGTALVEQVAAPPLPTVEYGYKQINGYWAVTSFRLGDQATLYWRYDTKGRRTGVEQGSLRWFYTYDNEQNTYGQPAAMVWSWNGQGDPGRTTGARRIRYAYDERGQLVGAEDPAGGRTIYGYDGAGRLVSVTDALERTSTVAYDAAGRVARQVDALGGETIYAYDAAGRLTTVTDAEGSTTTYAYDYAGRVTGITDPLNRSMTLAYGSEGELLSRTDARGDTVTVTNDALGRPLALAYPGGQIWRVTYDAAGNVTTLSGDGLTRAYQRDVAGRVLQVADIRAGRTTWTSYDYGPSGQVAEMRTSDGGRTTYGYGSVGELKRITGPLGVTEYTYETVGQLAPQRVGVRSGPLRTTLTYDALGQLATVRQWQQAQSQGVDRTTRYAYDAVGNTVSIETPEGTRAFAYDELDRLVATSGTDGVKTTYAYDAVGDRTALKVGRAAPIEYRYDAAHQLLQAGDTEYTYDLNGRLVSEASAEGLRTYSWDYQGRLALVAERGPGALPFPLGSATAGETVATYRYALTGERVQTVRGEGAPEILRYDGAHAVATLDESGSAVESRQQGAGWDEWTIVANEPDEAGGEASVVYPLAEAHGTVVGAADEAGALVQQVAYDPWGTPLAATGEAITSTVTLPGFQGHTYEADTGLYDLRARWYDPEVGRFISPDPVRAPFSTAGLNPYVFGMNNPLRYTDPTGEIVPLIIAAAIIGAAFYASYSGASYAFSTSWECFSGWEMARRIAVGAAIGAAVGAGGYLLGLGAGAAFGAMGLSGVAAGIASGAVAGAGAGAGQSVLTQWLIDGRSLSDLDGGAILRSAVIGALAGGIAGGLAPGSLFSKPAGYVLRFFMSKMTGGLLGTFASQMFGI